MGQKDSRECGIQEKQIISLGLHYYLIKNQSLHYPPLFSLLILLATCMVYLSEQFNVRRSHNKKEDKAEI